MTSPPPLLYDTNYHIYNRGVNRQNIFLEERNYDLFMRLYDRHLAPVTDLFASNQFSNFFNAYAKTINKIYRRTGSLFQHPFGRVPITTDRHYSPRSEAEWGFWNVIAYIHQSPQKHEFVKDFQDWKWSSYGLILAEKPTKLRRDIVLDWFGGKDNYLELHQQWVLDADAKWFAEDDFD